jgi:hypothetical protein
VRFRYHEDERLHQLRIKQAMSDWKTISSCGDTEAEARPQFSLDGYAVVED